MFIGVARTALRGEAEVSMVEIPNPNAFPLSRGDVICRVAAAANHSGMRAFEDVTGLSMIEIVVGRFPFDDVELGSQVFGVTCGAFLIAARLLHDSGVKTLVFLQPLSDLSVTSGALEFARTYTEA